MEEKINYVLGTFVLLSFRHGIINHSENVFVSDKGCVLVAVSTTMVLLLSLLIPLQLLGLKE